MDMPVLISRKIVSFEKLDALMQYYLVSNGPFNLKLYLCGKETNFPTFLSPGALIESDWCLAPK